MQKVYIVKCQITDKVFKLWFSNICSILAIFSDKIKSVLSVGKNLQLQLRQFFKDN